MTRHTTRPRLGSQTLAVRQATWAILAVTVVWYWFLLTNGTFDPWAREPFGTVFDDMAARLLRFDFTIDPRLIEREAFIRDGKTYAYFGVFPALLRMVPVALGDPFPQLSRLSCWTALSIAAWAQATMLLAAYQRMPRLPRMATIYAVTLVAALLTGPQLTLTFSSYIYNEAIVWGATFDLLFICQVLICILDRRSPTAREWVALGALCGLAFNTRPTDAVAMTLGLGALGVILPIAEAMRGGPAGAATVRGVVRAAFWSSLIFLPLFAVTLLVNWQRWGTPFEFMPFALNIQAIEDPRRLRLAQGMGSFSLIRIPFAVLYYFFGMPGRGALSQLLDRYFDSVAWPRSLFVLTATALLTQTTLGCAMIFRSGIERTTRLGLLTLLAVPTLAAGMLLALSYLNYRYRYGFVPLFGLGATLGLMACTRLGDAARRRIAIILLIFTIGNVAISHVDLLQAKLSSFALYGPARDKLARQTRPLSDLFGDPAVRDHILQPAP